MSIKSILLFLLKDFINEEGQFDGLLSNQEKLLEKVTVLENKLDQEQKFNYINYLTLKNLLIFLTILLISGGFIYAYKIMMFDIHIINSCINELNLNMKDLAKYIEYIQKLDMDSLTKLMEGIHKLLNERTGNQEKMLLDILNYLQKNYLENNKSELNKEITDSYKVSDFKFND